MRRSHQLLALVLLAVCTSAWAGDEWQPTDGWYTLHHDVMRTGRSEDAPARPFKVVWHRKFWDEMISPEVEAIIAEDLLFIGTWKGNFYALEANTGEEVWTQPAIGGVRHAACYDPANKTILYATIGDAGGGQVVCRTAKTGEQVWAFTTPKRGGFITSPGLYDGKVYIGSRRGVLYCLDAKSGETLWTYQAPEEAPYMQNIAARDGKVIIAAEDMVPRCFDAATGEVLWEGPKMQGDSVRWYYPVFWKDTVIFRTCAPDDEINNVQSLVLRAVGEDGEKREAVFKEHGWSKAFYDFQAQQHKMYTPEKYQTEQEYIRQAIQDGQAQQTFYWLNVADGTERMVTSIVYTGSENGYSTPTPPSIDFDGNCYVLYKSFYTQFQYPIRFYDCIGTLDWETGIPTMLPKDKPSHGSVFPITADEVNMFTWGGRGEAGKLYDTHDHTFAYWDSASKKVLPAFAPKSLTETWGGLYITDQQREMPDRPNLFAPAEGPTASLNINTEWNGTSRGSVAIYKNKVWWCTGSIVICLEGGAQ